MTDVEFADAMDHIAGAYRDNRYSEDKVLKTWIEYFGRFDLPVFMDVLDEWIINEPKSPAISDIHHKCEVEQKKADKQKAHDALDDFLDTPEDRAAHPYDDGWRVDDYGKWVQVRV